MNSVLTVQQRIASLAARSPEFAFFSLAHHIDLYWLEAAYHRTRKDGAAGIDDVTGKQYAENLHENLQNLLDRDLPSRHLASPSKSPLRVASLVFTKVDFVRKESDQRERMIATVRQHHMPAWQRLDLRARLLRRIVRFPARPQRPPGAGHGLARDDERGRRLGP